MRLQGAAFRSNLRHFKGILQAVVRRKVPIGSAIFLIFSFGISGCGYYSANSVPGASLTLPTSLAFGAVTVGHLSTLQAAVVNSGSTAVTIYQVTISGQPFSVTGEGSLPITLAAGSSLNLAVQFDPTATGQVTGNLTVTSNAGTSPQAVVGLSGAGTATVTAPTPTLSISPSSVSFGNIGLNYTSTQSVTLTSTGGAPLTVNAATVAGTGFTLTPANLPATLNPGQTLTLQLQFSPTTLGASTGQLSITSNSSASPTAQVNLSGTGVSAAGLPALTVNPTSVAFGSVGVNASSTQYVTLVSGGSAPLTINSATLTGTGFSLSTSSFPATLNPGQTLALSVQFSPTTAGPATGQLSIASNSSTNATVVVSLSGTGTTSTAAPNLSINASSVAFGTVAVNSSSTQSVVLSSTGSTAVTISAATLGGTGFTLSGLTAPVTLNPGQNVTVSLQFSPTVAGAATGQLTITSNSSANPTLVITLSGTGTQHLVDLAWYAPVASPDPLSGYHLYRSIAGANAFQFLATVDISLTTYSDTTVQGGSSYDYIVKSVDTLGVESGPSNTTTAAIP